MLVNSYLKICFQTFIRIIKKAVEMFTIKELLNLLRELTNLKISQTDIAKALGTTRSNISLRIKNESKATIEEIKKVVIYLKLPNPHDIMNLILKSKNQLSMDIISENIPEVEDVISMDYYPDVFGSCGAGAFVFSEHKEVLQVPKRCIKSYSGFKKYSVINATGDSMTPYIFDKDKLVLEHWQGEQIRDNRIYLFRYGDNIFIKRLILNVDQIIIKSDNKEYAPRYIDKENMADFQIIGRIVGIWREES